MRLTAKLLLTTSAAALFASACNPQLGGKEGNLTLTFDKGASGGAVGSSPVAVGAKLAYSAYPKGLPDQKVTFTSATSNDDKVLRVDKVDGGLMTLEAVGAGQTTVDVDATQADGSAISDAFDLKAAKVDALAFANPCASDNGQALYLVDQDIDLNYTMRSGGTVAVGYGYYPVQVDGATLGQTKTNGLLPLHTAASAGQVTLTSQVGDASFSFTTVEPGAINGAELFEQSFLQGGNLPVEQGKELGLHLLPTVQGLVDGVQDPVPVCQADLDVQLQTSTPDICEVSYGPRDDEKTNLFHLYEPNEVTVKGLAEGTCEFTATIAAADGGNGISQSFSVDVSKQSQSH